MDKEVSVYIRRNNKLSFSARKFRILLDDIEILNLSNGECSKFYVTAGLHKISVAIGKKICDTTTFKAHPGDNINLVCQAAGNGAKIMLTNIDVSFQVDSKFSNTPNKNIFTFIIIFLALIILFFGITITFKVNFLFIPT